MSKGPRREHEHTNRTGALSCRAKAELGTLSKQGQALDIARPETTSGVLIFEVVLAAWGGQAFNRNQSHKYVAHVSGLCERSGRNDAQVQ